MLERLIGNPIALFNQNKDFIAGTEGCMPQMEISRQAKEYRPQFYSKYTYFRQTVVLDGENSRECEQYFVKWRVMYNRSMYLVGYGRYSH